MQDFFKISTQLNDWDKIAINYLIEETLRQSENRVTVIDEDRK